MRHTYLLLLALASTIASVAPQTGHAHNPRFSYIWLQVNPDGLQGRVEAQVADLKRVTGLALSHETGLTPAQLAATHPVDLLRRVVELRPGQVGEIGELPARRLADVELRVTELADQLGDSLA